MKKLLARGNTAEVYEYSEGKVCKLFFEGYPAEYVELEFRNAKELYDRNIRVPVPFKLITIDNRRGIIYEKIEGRSLLNLIAENPEKADKYIDILTKTHLAILSQKSKELLSYKDFLSVMVKNRTADYREICTKMDALPDGDHILHGDFHPNNILMEENGTPVVIDFMNVCRGPKLFDIARTVFLIRPLSEYMAERYLEKVQVSEEEIKEYLDVIAICRNYEG
ncbi:MAG: phosphotransferase [Lachnospiraceae bacterium]|nr:phosphotransferase [Lachnospiraceae bacterium]